MSIKKDEQNILTYGQLGLLSDSYIQDKTLKIANELTYAKHKMTENEMKVWFTVISSIPNNILRESHDNSLCFTYEVDKIASVLSGTKRMKRLVLRKALIGIARKQIHIMKRFSEDEDKQRWLFSSIFSSIDYIGDRNEVEITIDRKLTPYLFGLREKFTEIEMKEITALKGVLPMKIYLLIKDLIKNDIFSLPIDDFKKRLDLEKSYKVFNEFKRRILTKAESEIRKHTTMKDFHFTDDGSRGRKATTISFSLTKDIITHTDKITTSKTDIDELVQKLSHIEQDYHVKYILQKVTSKVAYDLIKNNNMEIIISNYEYFIEQKRSKKNINAGYLVKAVKNDYAKNRRKELIERANSKEINFNKQEEQATITSTIIDHDDCIEKAAKYIKKASTAVLLELIEENSNKIITRARRVGFALDIDRLNNMISNPKRDMRYKEMVIFKAFITTRIEDGDIEYIF